jgi:hypothetical protein
MSSEHVGEKTCGRGAHTGCEGFETAAFVKAAHIKYGMYCESCALTSINRMLVSVWNCWRDED